MFRSVSSKRLIFILMTCCALASLCALAHADCRLLLPAENAVKGFRILAKSLQYGKEDGITAIYNGGYELYTKAGVTEAARQMYHSGNDYVEITTHAMKSNDSAKSFLTYWQKQNHNKKLQKFGSSNGFVVTNSAVTGYMIYGKSFVTVSAFYAKAKAGKDVKAFMLAIDKVLGAYSKRK